jgi:molybdopterin molybdotransferase
MVTEIAIASSCDTPDGLITIEQACSRAAAYASVIEEHEEVLLGEALGRTLAAPVTSVLPLPPFDQSAQARDIFIEEMQLCLLGRQTPEETGANIAERVQPLLPKI